MCAPLLPGGHETTLVSVQVLLAPRPHVNAAGKGAPVDFEAQLVCRCLDPVLGIGVSHGLRPEAINSQDDIARAQVGRCCLASRGNLEEIMAPSHCHRLAMNGLSFMPDIRISAR